MIRGSNYQRPRRLCQPEVNTDAKHSRSPIVSRSLLLRLIAIVPSNDTALVEVGLHGKYIKLMPVEVFVGCNSLEVLQIK